MTATGDRWNPDQYARFSEERSRPFFDLLALVHPAPGGRAIDLGCGTGELTRHVHDHVGASATIGLDRSDSMLNRSEQYGGDGLTFVRGDIATFAPDEPYDVVFSNAAVQWVEDHPALFPRLAAAVKSGGQLAIQMPANHDHPSHRTAAELGAEEPFASATGGYARRTTLLAPETYAEILDNLGFTEQHVRLQVYPHHLGSRDDVIEWVKGSLLTAYREQLSPDLYAEFLDRYRQRLIPRLSEARPYFYPFKRLLIWGRKA